MSGEATAPAGYSWCRRLLTPARTCAGVATLAVATGIVVELRRQAAWVAADSSHQIPHATAPAAVDSPSAARLRRPRYRHSVIVGGAVSREEVQGVAREDAVVAAHYRGVDLDRLRATTVRQPRDVFVSYRLGRRVYWTREPVRLAVGEGLLTDGTNEIRVRCGNRISDIPQAPVSDQEPVLEGLDHQQDPRGGSSVTGPSPLASAAGARAHVAFLSLVHQPLVGGGPNGPSDAATWPVSQALAILGVADPFSPATTWGEPLGAIVGPTGRGATDGPIVGGRSGGGSPGAGGSTGGSDDGDGSGGIWPEDGDSGGTGDSGSSNGPGGSPPDEATGGDFGSGGGSVGSESLPTIYPGSEGVVITDGHAPAVPEPGTLAMLGLGVAAAVARWARKPRGQGDE